MDFFKFIQSLDELIYEIVSWLLFYPMTLWRVLRHPARVMESTAHELEENWDVQFDEVMGPPLFLFLTLVLLHVAELSTLGQNSLVTGDRGLAYFVTNDLNYLILRVVVFGSLALSLARRMLLASGQKVTKEGLRSPFYAQCYATALLAIWLEVAIIVGGGVSPFAPTLGGAVAAAGLAWFVTVETVWLRNRLGISSGRAIGESMLAVFQWAVAMVTLIALTAYPCNGVSGL